jgi:hypothetical protein
MTTTTSWRARPQADIFKFTMKVAHDSGQSASQQFKLTINDGGGRQ